jgi:hypothetical protein
MRCPDFAITVYNKDKKRNFENDYPEERQGK